MKNKNLSVVELTRNAMQTTDRLIPIHLTYTNHTNEVKKVCAFEIFNQNQKGVTVENMAMAGGNNMSLEFLKKYFYENPHLSCKVRLQSTTLMGVQSESPIYLVSKNPMGLTYSRPAIIPLDSFSKFQFQSGIMDVQCSFVLDGLTNDLEFNLIPNSTIVIIFFFSERLKGRSRKQLDVLLSKQTFTTCKHLGSVVIENNSNEAKEIILFDIKKYKEDYMLRDDLRIFGLFSTNYQDICSQFENQHYIFNSIRIFITSGSLEDKHKQCLQPIEFNSGSKYYPSVEINGNEFQAGVNDVNIIGEELSSDNQMKVTVMPNTRVVYLFKHQNGLIATTTNDRFMSIEVENLSDVCKKVDILSSNTIDNVRHSIGKNKLALTENDFKPNLIRFQLYKQLHAEQPILIKSTDSKGVITSTDIFPICFIDENSFNGNVITIPFDFSSKLKDTEILVDLESKGDGMNVILFKSQNELSAIKGGDVSGILSKPHDFHLFPIWIENKTENTISVELPNNIDDLKDFPEGINCHVGVKDSYRMLLDRVEAGNYESLDIVKLYSKSNTQIVQIIELSDYTDTENPITIPILTQGNISISQFQREFISLQYPVKLDLTRIDYGVNKENDSAGNNYETKKTKISKKQKLVFTILPKATLALICNLKKNI